MLYLGTDNAGTNQFALQDFEPSASDKLGATVRQAWLESYGPTAVDYYKSKQQDADDPKLSADEANAQIKESGVKVNVTPQDGQYTRAQLDILTGRQRALTAAQDVRDRTPWSMGSPFRGAAMFAAGIVDPINLATAFVPWTRSISALNGVRAATAAESLLARSAARFTIGAVDAGISTAALEPFYYGARQELGDDYHAIDSIANIAFGTLFGGGIHAIGGAGADAIRGWRNRSVPVETINPLKSDVPTGERVAGGAERADVAAAADRAESTAARASESSPEPAARSTQAIIVERDAGNFIGAENRSGVVGGTVQDGNLRINTVESKGVTEAPQQNVALLERLVNEAVDRGLTITSESIDPKLAQAVRDLEQKGFKVTETEGGAVLPDDSASPDGQLAGATPATPVFLIERGEGYRPPVESAADVAAKVSPETREAALRASVAQSVDGRNVDVEAIVGMDPARRTATMEDAKSAADRNFTPDQLSNADPAAVAQVDERVAASSKTHDITDVERAAADADAALAETIRSGDNAFKYSRGDVATDTPAFKKWFSGSKVVDADGNPLVVYHGTGSDIYRFDPSNLGTNTEAKSAHEAFFFTSSKDVASGYAALADTAETSEAKRLWSVARNTSLDSATREEMLARAGDLFESDPDFANQMAFSEIGVVGGANVVPSYLSMKNPLVIDYKLSKYRETSFSENIKKAKDNGNDGVIFKNTDDSTDVENKGFSDVYAAFKPEQIKSAIGNNGEFNSNNPDIRYSQGEKPLSGPELLTESLRQSFGKSTDAMIEAGQIKIVERPNDIPYGPHPGDVKAATQGDQVYIVSSNVTAAEARGLVLHEVGVHVGMERMLGPVGFENVLKNLDEAILRGEDWAKDAVRKAIKSDTPQERVREETLAYLVEHSPELPIVQRIVAAIRAWVYKHFSAAQNSLQLTEADYRALATSALHAVARGEGEGSPGIKYSRGDVPEPPKPQDELKDFDYRVERAKGYADVLRAAADKLDNDAQATAAMRGAMPDITAPEIDELLAQLRKQVKGLRIVARETREQISVGDTIADLQPEALKAADELANNIKKAAVIEKRNAALDLNARLKGLSFIGQFKEAKLEVEGFRALLVGTERKRSSGRLSVDAEQKSFRGLWIGGLQTEMDKGGHLPAFISGNFDRDIATAMWNLDRKDFDLSKLPKEAVDIARIVNKYQTDARNTRNRFGAWIGDLQGYVVRQTHDMYKIRGAGEKAWSDFVLPRLKDTGSLGSSADEVASTLSKLYDDFATGTHIKVVTDDVDTVSFSQGSSLAKRVSQSRGLIFKDGAAFQEYNEKFGSGRLSDAVIGGLDQAAKSAGLMKVLGTNPEATLKRMFDEVADGMRGDPARRAKFLSAQREVENLLSHVDGSANIPGNATAAKVGTFLRGWQSLAKLGGALLSSVSDLTNYAAELRFGQNKNLLSGTLDGIGALIRGRADGEKRDVLTSLGVFHDSMLGSVHARFDSPELTGKMAAAMQTFFKLNGLTWWTESLRDGYALQHSNYLAQNAKHAHDKLPAALRDMLGLYNIDAGKWDILRVSAGKEIDGRLYMTPEGIKTVPESMLVDYIKSVGRTPSDAAIGNLRDDLASSLRTMTIDRMHHAVIEPNARARAFMLRGTQPGTVPGEMLRYITQFKSFPVAMIQMALGREVYGRGYDTLSDYLKNGKGDMLGLATFIGMSTMMGYAAMSAKDMVKGKNPRPVDDPRTWAAAMVQGGGLGIYGDFLFNKYNRMGGTLSGSLGGPVVALADTVADLWTRLRTGDDFAAVGFNALLQNTPFMNLFYTRTAMDYLILYRMQEAMNPGFLRRMERRAERENGQTWWLPPTSAGR